MRLHHLAILLGVVAVARAQGNANGGANAGNGVNAGNGANADPNDEDGVAGASTYTTTLPWANGNTEIIVVTSDGEGDVETLTVSTINGAVGAVPAANTKTTTTKNAAAAVTATTTGPRVVGVASSNIPMRTTTYGYEDGDGNWITATWTASVTAAPSEATFQAPAGTIQDYNSYQNGVNKVVLSSAEQALASQSGGGGAISGNIGAAARRRDMSSVATWTGVLAVAMGFGVGAAML